MFRQLKKQFKRNKGSILNWGLFLISPILSFILVEYLNGNVNIFTFHPIRFVYNLIIYYALYFVLLFITNRFTLSIIIGILFFSGYGIINTFVQQFRGSPILPFDIYSLTTAMNVASEYSFIPSLEMIVVAVISLLFIGLTFFVLKKQKHIIKKKIRFTNFIISCLLCITTYCLFFNTSILADHDMSISTWSQSSGYHDNGVMLSFMDNVTYMTVKKPKAYNSSKVEELLVTNSTEKGIHDSNHEEIKNVIVIMNESYSDLSVINEFATNIDYLSYYHSLDNAIKGNTYVSILGGGTANSEFEFLTGNSLAFLPSGSMAYQMYMKNGVTSLVDIMKMNGFYSTAIHTYFKSGWNRENVYDMMGFDQKYFIEDYILSPEDMFRVYPSDQFTYEKVIETYENSTADKNFIFCVTMQNHGGYAFEGYENEVNLIDYPEYSYGIEQYLTSLYHSDQALATLVDYFSNIDEPTVILQFGDHQPTANNGFIEELYQKPLDSLTVEEMQKQYITPYLLWANYPLDETEGKDMSLNYLSNLLLEVVGIAQPDYYQFLNQLYDQYPVINSIGAINQYGQCFTINELKDDPWIQAYQNIQYNNLFDVKHKNMTLYIGEDPQNYIPGDEVAKSPNNDESGS